MKITLDWLEEQDACSECVSWWESCGEVDGAAVVRLLLAADFKDAVMWANWLVARLLDRPNQLRYAIHAAESVVYLAGPAYWRVKRAISAAERVLANDTKEIRQKAAQAADAALSVRLTTSGPSAWAAEAAVLGAGSAWAAEVALSAPRSEWAVKVAALAAWAGEAETWSAARAMESAARCIHLRKFVEFGLDLLEGK